MIRYDNTAKTAGVPQNTPAAITNPTARSRKDAMSAGGLGCRFRPNCSRLPESDQQCQHPSESDQLDVR